MVLCYNCYVCSEIFKNNNKLVLSFRVDIQVGHQVMDHRQLVFLSRIIPSQHILNSHHILAVLVPNVSTELPSRAATPKIVIPPSGWLTHIMGNESWTQFNV